MQAAAAARTAAKLNGTRLGVTTNGACTGGGTAPAAGGGRVRWTVASTTEILQMMEAASNSGASRGCP